MKKNIIIAFLIVVVGFSVWNSFQPKEEFRLKNGHTVIIKEIKNNPIFVVDTWVKTGSIDENATNNGVAHFLEHLFFKGTKNRKAGEFEKELDALGASFNAATSKDYTHFYIEAPKENFDEVLELHLDMMGNVAIPEDELAMERKVVQEEIRRGKDNPNRIVFNNLSRLVFKDHPYRREVIGTEEIIGQISRDEVLNFYHKNYTPKQMTTIVVGDVETKKVLEKFRKNLIKKKKSNGLPCPASSPPRNDILKNEIIEKGSFNTGYLLLGFKGVDIKDEKDNIALDIVSEILGSGKTSRLYKKIKTELNLAKTISAGHMSMREDSLFFVSASFEPQNYTLLKRAVINEIKKLDSITEEEIAKAKNNLKKAYLYSNESISGIAQNIGYDITVAGNLDYFKKHDKYIDAVKMRDVKRVVKKYLTPDKIYISTLLNQNIQPQELMQEKQGNVTKTTFGNGMILINELNDTSDIIALTVMIKGGKFLDKTPGTSGVLASMLMKGTTSMPEEELSKRIEDMGISIVPSAKDEYLQISLKCTKDDFDEAFELLKEILANPAFEREKLEEVKGDISYGIKKKRDLPVNIAFEEFYTELFKGTPYGHTGKIVENTIYKITVDDLKNFHKSYFNPLNMVVAASGNIDTETLIDKLSALQVTGESKKFNFDNIKNTKISFPSTKTKTKKEFITTAWLVKGWATPGIAEQKDYASLKIISSILGGSMSSRLFVNIRERQGLAYEIGSFYQTKPYTSAIVMYMGTDPQNLMQAKKGFNAEIERLKSEKVTEKELNKAKGKIIGNYLLSQETNSQKAHYLGYWEMIGQGYNFDYASMIRTVSVDDIMRVSQKYFNSPSLTVVVAI